MGEQISIKTRGCYACDPPQSRRLRARLVLGVVGENAWWPRWWRARRFALQAEGVLWPRAFALSTFPCAVGVGAMGEDDAWTCQRLVRILVSSSFTVNRQRNPFTGVPRSLEDARGEDPPCANEQRSAACLPNRALPQS